MKSGQKISTLDLAGKGKFSLFTDISGEAWKLAAQKISIDLGIEIETYIIGPGREITDVYNDWHRSREVAEDGCLFVRPDAHVAWRCKQLPSDPVSCLKQSILRITGRSN